MTDKVISFSEFLVKEIVSNKDAVKVSLTEDEGAFIFNIDVAEEDKGKVIGKEGRTANAIRTVIRSYAGKLTKRVVIKFV